MKVLKCQGMDLILLTLEYCHLNQTEQEFNLLNGTMEMSSVCWSHAVWQV